jgi:hypothetical protein
MHNNQHAPGSVELSVELAVAPQSETSVAPPAARQRLCAASCKAVLTCQRPAPALKTSSIWPRVLCVQGNHKSFICLARLLLLPADVEA